MRTSFLSLPLLLLGLPCSAGAAEVQWLSELPPESMLAELERELGESVHHDGESLAWPAAPAAAERNVKALAALEREVADSRARWNAFDVEKDIAWRLGQAIEAVELLEGQAQREQLYRALLLQGAAVSWAWSPVERERTPDAEPYLIELSGRRLLQPWVDAVALFPDREPGHDELPDMTTYRAFLRQREHLLEQRVATLVPVGLPADATVVVDGLSVDEPGRVQLVPGLHRVHLVRDGVAAPSVLRLTAGQEHSLVGLVTVEDLDKANERVLDGNLLEVPPPVKDRVERLRGDGGETWHIAGWEGHGNPAIFELQGDEPWMVGEYERDMLVLVEASLGVGLLGSTMFSQSDGTNPHTAAGTVLDLGAQLAWRRWAGFFELSVFDTTGRADIAYGDVATETNKAASSFARLTLAPGFYVLRLRPRRTHFVVTMPVGLLSPAHSGIGAQAWFGIPLGRTTWLRLGFDFFKGNELPKWEVIDGVNDPLTTLSLRVGVAQKLH